MGQGIKCLVFYEIWEMEKMGGLDTSSDSEQVALESGSVLVRLHTSGIYEVFCLLENVCIKKNRYFFAFLVKNTSIH